MYFHVLEKCLPHQFKWCPPCLAVFAFQFHHERHDAIMKAALSWATSYGTATASCGFGPRSYMFMQLVHAGSYPYQDPTTSPSVSSGEANGDIMQTTK